MLVSSVSLVLYALTGVNLSCNSGPCTAYTFVNQLSDKPPCTILVFFYFMLPEMKGRSLEELDELFQNRVSIKDFKKYQCVSSERAREIALKEAGEGVDEKAGAVVETVEDTAASKV